MCRLLAAEFADHFRAGDVAHVLQAAAIVQHLHGLLVARMRGRDIAFGLRELAIYFVDRLAVDRRVGAVSLPVMPSFLRIPSTAAPLRISSARCSLI